MSKILVVHSYYGCDTGCCGHVIEIDGEKDWGTFQFEHPSGYWFEWAKEFVADECGPEHVADLDWENCRLVDD